ncbi:MAG: DUF559 domain-containing protein [Solirubrobacterales bacterium]
MDSRTIDEWILEMARRQHGLISRQQLTGKGIDRWQIDVRKRTARLIPVVDGVYAVGHDRLNAKARLQAGLLFAGPQSVLSHHSAALHWGLAGWLGPVHVLRDFNRVLPGRKKDRWLVVHRTRFLPENEVARHAGFPVTSVERTLLDLAAKVDERKLESCLTAAERLRVFDLTRMEQVLERGPGWKGIGRLRRVLNNWNHEITMTRSDLEERFFSICRRKGLPLPAVNVVVEGFEVDCLWRDDRLIVELDSRAHHLNPIAFETDRHRDGILQAAGYRVRRITYRSLEEDPEAAVDSVTKFFTVR